jgi:hypothetical protein
MSPGRPPQGPSGAMRHARFGHIELDNFHLGQCSGMTADCDEGSCRYSAQPWRTSGPPSATHAGRAKLPRSRSFATSFPAGRFRLDGCTFTREDGRGWSLPRSGSLVRALASLRRDGSSSNAALDSCAKTLSWASVLE